MASEHSMDIVVNFDFQELRNAVEQAKKEALNRYDLKDAKIEIELNENDIKVAASSEYQVEAVFGIIVKKVVGRNLSPKILDRQKVEEAGGMRYKQEIKLIKALDQENAKEISKKIRDAFPKSKASIQGDVVRVISKEIDELQSIQGLLRADEKMKVPIIFTNYR
ncbi:MAG: YajQ family cyclic di-GMP-binding protein [Candidatus Gracilibacteria bacterium]|jgi:hypothetical protein